MNKTPSPPHDTSSSANSSRWQVYLLVIITSGTSGFFALVLAMLSINQTVIIISVLTSIACFIFAISLVDRGKDVSAFLVSLAITPIFFGVMYLFAVMSPFVMTVAQKVTETGHFIVANVNDPQPALDRALQYGAIRKATAEDVRAFKEAYLEKNNTSKNFPEPNWENALSVTSVDISRAYVVLKEFTYPSGLINEYRVTFFLPKGVPEPTGNMGHSALYDFQTLTVTCSAARTDGISC
jgi:hypothetical protein